MATNPATDDILMKEAQLIGKTKTKKAVDIEALEGYIQKRKQTRIFELFGNMDYHYKKQGLCVYYATIEHPFRQNLSTLSVKVEQHVS